LDSSRNDVSQRSQLAAHFLYVFSHRDNFCIFVTNRENYLKKISNYQCVYKIFHRLRQRLNKPARLKKLFMDNLKTDNFWQFDAAYWFKELNSSENGLSQADAEIILNQLINTKRKNRASKKIFYYLLVSLKAH